LGKHERERLVILDVINRFTDVSDAEKESGRSLIEFLESKDYSLGDLLKVTPQYRPTEGRAFLGLLRRLKSLVGADKVDIEGVYSPLDVDVDASRKKIKIFLPEDLDTYADSGIIHELMRFQMSEDSVEFGRARGPMVTSDREGDFFVMGYITEIISNQRIEKISFTKGASYQIGRMCARTKTLLSVLDQQKVPTKFLKIPERYLGGTAKFKEPEIIRALQTYFKSDQVEHLRRLLESLLEHSIRVNREKHEGKIGLNVFLPASEILHAFKRKTRKTLQKTKRGNSVTVVESVDPTKPSQLATVAPWERDVISEIYEDSWNYQKKLIADFEKQPALSRDYNDLGKHISEIVGKQWEAKQRVLRATKHRIEGYTGKQDDPLFKKLNWVRSTLSEWATLERVPAVARPDFDPYLVLPPRISKAPELESTSLDTLVKEDRVKAYFPHTARLLKVWESLSEAAKGPEDPSAKSIPER
jgi:hypothetical protein